MFAGQQYKPCDQCKNTLQFLCTSCSFGLCEGCVAIHLQSPTDSIHNVINYRDRYSDKKTSGICDLHRRKFENKFFCTHCKKPLCKLCLPRHNMIECHVIEMKDFVMDKVQSINEQNNILSNVVEPKLRSMIKEIRKNIHKTDFSMFEKEIEKYKMVWYGQIDKIVSKFQIYGRKLCSSDKRTLIRRMFHLEKLLTQTTTVLNRNTQILKSPEDITSINPCCTDKISVPNIELSAEKHTLEAKRTIDDTAQSLNNVFANIQKHLDECKVENTDMNENVTYKILKNVIIQSPSMDPQTIICKRENILLLSSPNVSDDELLIFNQRGKFMNRILIKFFVYRMAVMQNGNILFLLNDRIIQLTGTFSEPWTERDKEWKTMDITTHVSATEEVYACQFSEYSYHGRVVKWDLNGESMQVIDKKINPDHILCKYPTYVRINGNSDICVIDKKFNSLVVGDKRGFTRFVYTAEEGKIQGLAINSQCHIFLNDCNRITELDENGTHLRYILENQSMFIRLFEIDSDDNMWIINSKHGKAVEDMLKIIFRS